MTVAELIAKLKELPPEAEVVPSGYGTTLPRLVVHDVSAHGDMAFLSLCTPEVAQREKDFWQNRNSA